VGHLLELRSWNLTPFEERWEAIEACERAFEGTRQRVSTANITLAKTAGPLILLRVGEPTAIELATWRYASKLRLRRREATLATLGGLAVVGALYSAAFAVGLPAGLALGVPHVRNYVRGRRVLVRMPTPGGEFLIRYDGAQNFSWVPPEAGEGWRLRYIIPRRENYLNARTAADRRRLREEGTIAELGGDAAAFVVRQILPAINDAGATEVQVAAALELTQEGDPFAWDPGQARIKPIPRHWNQWGRRDGSTIEELEALPLHTLPPGVRLAMEMVTGEETERRAMEGELHLLEAAWREAEEIARLADSLAFPWLESQLRRLGS
jgi:hypothetical protein